MRRRADGSGTNELVLPGNLEGGDPDLTPDGQILVYRDLRLDNILGYDIGADSTFAIVVDNIRQVKPAISPDGLYVVYAQAGDENCGSIQVSAVRTASEPIEIAANGCLPVWTHGGNFIYYQDASRVSRVRVTTDPVFEILGQPEVAYRANINRAVGDMRGLYFDVAADGTLYVAHGEARENESRSLWVVHNWFEELNRLAPRSE